MNYSNDNDNILHWVILGITAGILLLILGLAKSCGWEEQRNIRINNTVPVAFADSCSLEVVICDGEITEPTVEQIILAISQRETGGCKYGVGRSKNNCTGIVTATGYRSFASPEDSLDFSVQLWRDYYAGIEGLDSQLARWKTGSAINRDPETLKYIADIRWLLTKGGN